MHATRAAVEEGILPGGGVALLRAGEALKKLRTHNDDQKTGVEIVRKAISWPRARSPSMPARTARSWSARSRRTPTPTATTRRRANTAISSPRASSTRPKLCAPRSGCSVGCRSAHHDRGDGGRSAEEAESGNAGRRRRHGRDGLLTVGSLTCCPASGSRIPLEIEVDAMSFTGRPTSSRPSTVQPMRRRSSVVQGRCMDRGGGLQPPARKKGRARVPGRAESLRAGTRSFSRAARTGLRSPIVSVSRTMARLPPQFSGWRSSEPELHRMGRVR